MWSVQHAPDVRLWARRFGQHHHLLCVLRGSLHYMSWREKRETETVGEEKLGQIVEQADPHCRNSHIMHLLLTRRRQNCTSACLSILKDIDLSGTVCKIKGCIKYVSLRSMSVFSTVKKTSSATETSCRLFYTSLWGTTWLTLFHFMISMNLPLGLINSCQRSQRSVGNIGRWYSLIFTFQSQLSKLN